MSLVRGRGHGGGRDAWESSVVGGPPETGKDSCEGTRNNRKREEVETGPWENYGCTDRTDASHCIGDHHPLSSLCECLSTTTLRPPWCPPGTPNGSPSELKLRIETTRSNPLGETTNKKRRCFGRGIRIDRPKTLLLVLVRTFPESCPGPYIIHESFAVDHKHNKGSTTYPHTQLPFQDPT